MIHYPGFDAIRIAAAAAVVFSHSFLIASGHERDEPFQAWNVDHWSSAGPISPHLPDYPPIWLGERDGAPFRHLSKFGELSYGNHLWGWPV
jgi:peptidoglycan/LPS O-acetylase OafA/YrhL